MEVTPAVLEFKGPFTKPSTEKLILTNSSAETLAFKVKTTAPKLYCVRPNASIIQPGDSLEVSIISQGLKEEPASDFKCKDKFLLVTLPCPYNDAETRVAELWPSLESEFKATSKKIKVNYIIDNATSTPSGASKADNSIIDSSFASQQPGTTLVEESEPSTPLASSTQKSARAPVADDDTVAAAAAPVSSTTTSTATPVPASKGGIPLPLALVIAILAFLIGKYFL